MDPSEFPSLADSTASASSHVDKSSSLGASWAEVAQEHPHEENASSEDKENKKPEPQQPSTNVWDKTDHTASFAEAASHEPKATEEFPTPQESAKLAHTDAPESGGVSGLLHSATEHTEVKTSIKTPTKSTQPPAGVWDKPTTFAEVAGHEKKLSEEFPTPQESAERADTSDAPESGGVGDLLHSNAEHVDASSNIEPPNPVKSFADATSNKGFPTPKHDDTSVKSDLPPLSDLPDVDDMLKQPSVRIAPVPPAQSFAKIAAKEIPPEKRPLSDRAKDIINNQPTEDPLSFNNDNFPTLSQSNLMSEENASMEDKSMYAEISRFNQVADRLDDKTDKNVKSTLPKSFADITSSNLEDAPPSAVSHVDQHPVYDEETVYLENAKREERKHIQVEHGNNEQLIKEEKDLDNLPEEIVEEELEKEGKVTEKSRAVEESDDSLAVALHTFDKDKTGVITIFDTITALYKKGYSWLTILPGAFLMHIRLSPMTSPYGYPFIYRSLADLILLPIYTRNLNHALSYKTPLLLQGKEEASQMVEKYGHKSGSTRGLGYWDGLRALRNLEQNSLRWWQMGLWTVHRVQWTLAYTMLAEPKTNVVTAPTLISLSSED